MVTLIGFLIGNNSGFILEWTGGKLSELTPKNKTGRSRGASPTHRVDPHLSAVP